MLNSKQRAGLRKHANSIETIMQIGKGGINENLTKSISDALEAREMVKLRVLENSDYSAREAAENVALATNAQVIQVIGTRFVIYRQNKSPEKRKYVI
ncbi:MAG: YhbY family RNA-binding protein [Oscillospiraceae bacterium]|nr:YhbY family RNA-binding protein [Oscillospiraceae bacterium]